ncbi:MAG: DUF2442 domain-containing protein [Spirosomaceae bacterium]|nr:DUF2442 domain-containing protein [Spirosomataceae bacterium]
MNTSAKLIIDNVWFTNAKIFVLFSDGREVGCPLAWFPRLEKATQSQRLNYELICRNTGVHWEEVDEDLSAEGFLNYKPKQFETV